MTGWHSPTFSATWSLVIHRIQRRCTVGCTTPESRIPPAATIHIISNYLCMWYAYMYIHIHTYIYIFTVCVLLLVQCKYYIYMYKIRTHLLLYWMDALEWHLRSVKSGWKCCEAFLCFGPCCWLLSGHWKTGLPSLGELFSIKRNQKIPTNPRHYLLDMEKMIERITSWHIL